jgi:protein TonB
MAMNHKNSIAAVFAAGLLAWSAGASAQTVAAVSTADTPKTYKVDAAQHIYRHYAHQIFKGKLPPLVHAIVVCETEIDGDGHVRDVKMIRVPTHAPDVTVRVRDMIRKASPMPVPSRIGGTVRFLEVWLVDKSGRFQLDTLTEGQL